MNVYPFSPQCRFATAYVNFQINLLTQIQGCKGGSHYRAHTTVQIDLSYHCHLLKSLIFPRIMYGILFLQEIKARWLCFDGPAVLVYKMKEFDNIYLIG